MGVMLKKLVLQVSHMEFKLVAGENGMTNEVSWMHMVDSAAVSEFLQGHELVFTTGVGLNEQLTLFQLVKTVYQKNASGIVINIGPYISEIGSEIIDFANAHDFPVFEVPWKVHMAEVMRIFSFAITREEQNKLELSAALSNAFRCPAQEELYVSTLMQKGFLAEWKYYVCVARITELDHKLITDAELAQLSSKLSSHLQFYYTGVVCCALEGRIAIVIANYPEDQKDAMIREIFRYFVTLLRVNQQLSVCRGSGVSRLNALHISFEQAEKMLAILSEYDFPGEEVIRGKNGEKHTLLLFENTGTFRLVITITDKSALREYVNDTVEPLYEYDQRNQGDLVKTIRCYLSHNCSIKDVAEEMIVHRNTVNYKVKKAEEVTGMNLSDYNVRFELSLGFMAYEMLKSVL